MWARYRHNLARHLIGIARDLQSRVRQTLAEDLGYDGLRPSLAPLLSLLWDEGRPLAAVAEALDTSPQAASQLTSLAQAHGYLERTPHPDDGRSKLVQLTPRGRELVRDAVRIILESESEYAALVGPAAYRRFTSALGALYEHVALPTQADPLLSARARRSIGVLPVISLHIQQELMRATTGRGHAGLKLSHGEVLPLIGPEGARIHQLARVQGVTRQAISATSQDLEAQGYLRREPDPRDRRGVVLQLTKSGTRLIRDSVDALDGLDAGLREVLGDARFAALEKGARELYRALHLEEEIFEPAPGQADALGIHGLASRLRRHLGAGDAARLAELLEPRAKRTGT